MNSKVVSEPSDWQIIFLSASTLSGSTMLPLLILVATTLFTSTYCTSFLPFLNFSSPSPYIFHSLATLLQTWPQNVLPNGHTIASVTIPRHTLLYHGRHDDDPVPNPEWLAFDIEMAYGIMGSMHDSRMLTYRTSRDVKAVYFDGASANLMGEGTTSQMVLLYNGSDNVPRRGGRRPPPRHGHDDHRDERKQDDPPKRPPIHWNPLEDEYFRARGLCEWLRIRGLGGNGWGYEGVVRMNAGFELIWCDFKSPSLRLVSDLNVSAPLLEDLGQSSTGNMIAPRARFLGTQAILRVNDEGPHGPGMTDPREPFRDSANWFWFSAAAKRYFGDERIRVDRCGVFSFYDPELRNQTEARIVDERDRLNISDNGKWKGPGEDALRKTDLHLLMKRRRQHSLDHVSRQDAMFMRYTLEKRLKDVLRGEDWCTQVNWHHVAQDIVTRYSGELQRLAQALEAKSLKPKDAKDIRNWLQSTRQLTHWFLTPFLEYPPARPYDKDYLEEMFSLNSPLAKTTLERCQSQYNVDEYALRDEEVVLYRAIREAMTAICSTVVEIGLGVELIWLLYFNTITSNENTQTQDIINDIITRTRSWERKVEELMAWLGWVDRWTACDPSCGNNVSSNPHAMSFNTAC